MAGGAAKGAVTHVVCRTDGQRRAKRTIKYLMGIANVSHWTATERADPILPLDGRNTFFWHNPLSTTDVPHGSYDLIHHVCRIEPRTMTRLYSIMLPYRAAGWWT